MSGLLELNVQQAIGIFSPGGLTYFYGGAVFCLRGAGTLIWLAAAVCPVTQRLSVAIPSRISPGFTCATLFEPGTLILVAKNPIQ